MEHLTFEKARQEITVLNALVRAGVVDSGIKQSNEVAIAEGAEKLLNN